MAETFCLYIILILVTIANGQLILPGNDAALSEEAKLIIAMRNDETLKNAVHMSALQHLGKLNIDMEAANTTMSPLVPSFYNVSQKCVSNTMQYLGDIVEGKEYAITMFDSTGKLPSGVLDGNFQWVGSSKECRRVKNAPVSEDSFSGKYCQVFAPFPLVNASLQIGVCVPDSCNDMDVLTMVNTGLCENFVHIGIKIIQPPGLMASNVLCTEELPLSTGAKVMIIIVSILALLMVAGTVYDIIINYINRNADTNNPLPITVQDGVDKEEVTSLLNSASKAKQYRYQPGTFGECLLAFSVLTNGGKILDATHSSGTLAAIHGIRVLSMWWVILGHSVTFTMGFSDNGFTYAQDVMPRFTFQAILNATFSVDTFFFLSGLLVTYLTLRELMEGRKINWFLFYFHRFWRLTPVYMFVLFFTTYLVPYFGNGPYAQIMNENENPCIKYWWTNLLYINNIVPWIATTEIFCFPVSWYLANDMQFYIISPIAIVLLYKKPRLGYLVLSALMIICLGSRLGISIHRDLTSSITAQGQLEGQSMTYFVYSVYYYPKPWTRISTYLVGMIVGYLLIKTKCKVKINKVINLVCWCAAWVIALSVLYGLYGTQHGHTLSRPVDVLYMTVCRLAWSVAIGWLTFACLTGNGGPINAILSWKAWIPISRLTYCAYLTHFYVILVYGMNQDRLINLSDLNQTYMYIAGLVIAYCISFVVSLMAEAPMMRLEKILLRKTKKSL
ncbi:nose resistant to fluoxetine protein 6-like [Glandiceps talaboti]